MTRGMVVRVIYNLRSSYQSDAHFWSLFKFLTMMTCLIFCIHYVESITAFDQQLRIPPSVY